MLKRAGREAMSRAFFAVSLAMPMGLAIAQVNIVTERYDDSRLGANLAETTLDTSNVDANDFGKVWSYTVSGSVYAQPLYVHNMVIEGQGAHNVLYVVTMNDMLYAFDADSNTDAPLASLDLSSQQPGEFPVCVSDALGFNDNIIGNIGIESTPVIDLATNTIYLLVRTELSDTGACGGGNESYVQRLHALDLSTFEERPGSPVVISGSVPGNGSGSQGGMITFDPKIADQRSSLALTNGRIMIAWSAHSDQFNYHGWVMAYDAATLQQTMIWSSAPDGGTFNGAGVWMGGRAPAVDGAGNIYYTTGNGNWDLDTPNGRNYGESFVKFGPTPDVPLLDWFTPDDVQFLNDTDLDLGGSGPILVPGTDLIASAGKSGVFYVTHTASLGHFSTNDVNIVQEFDNSEPAGSNDQVKAGPIYWNRDGGLGPWMYVWADGCISLNAYHFNGATFDTTPVSQSGSLAQCSSTGGVLTLSANGSNAGSGIVWASVPTQGDANSGIHQGMMRAYDADDLSVELWNSETNHDRDDTGNWPKFSPPTVVNGRVYLGSFPDDGQGDTKVNVYSLFAPQPDFSLSASPPNPSTGPGGSVTYTLEAVPANGFNNPVHFELSGLPTGVTGTFTPNDVMPSTPVTLQLDVSASVALGEYPFHVTATTDRLVHDVALAVYVTDVAPGTGAISLDFVGSGTSLAASGVAGVVAKPNWNEADTTVGGPLTLVDETGTTTTATAQWGGSSVASLNLAATDPDSVMMNGYLDGDSSTIMSVVVSNLPPSPGGYRIYVYADSLNTVDAQSWYTITTDEGEFVQRSVDDPANTQFDGTFVEAAGAQNVGNYVTMVVGPTTGFTLRAFAAPGFTTDTALNGIQIVTGDRIFAGDFDE